jgi:carnosine N-methyltransferase
MLRSVTFPDVLPTDLPRNSNFSLVAGILINNIPQSLSEQPFHLGDFEEIYGARKEDYEDEDEVDSHEGAWDAVLTCFFIDTVCSFHEYSWYYYY